jgi:acyl-CoA thioester hydrolase
VRTLTYFPVAPAWSDRIAGVRHVYYCPLRWADMDPHGHVNNVTYVDYLQEARVDMLAVHAPVTGGEALAEGVVVVRHQVEFVSPLPFRHEPVRIETWVGAIRAASFTMRYEILDQTEDGDRHVYTRASTVLSPFVFASERPRRIRAEERAVLEQFLETNEEAEV